MMLAELRRIFDAKAENGVVSFAHKIRFTKNAPSEIWTRRFFNSVGWGG